VVTAQVASNGAILEIGTISKTTLAASINHAVKKSGCTIAQLHRRLERNDQCYLQ